MDETRIVYVARKKLIRKKSNTRTVYVQSIGINECLFLCEKSPSEDFRCPGPCPGA